MTIRGMVSNKRKALPGGTIKSLCFVCGFVRSSD
jgi:hypothetical protein